MLTGEVDALYYAQMVVEQKIRKNMITGLKAIPQNELPANKLYFYVNKKDPILYSIIQKKSLRAIPYEKKMQIMKKWLNLESIALTPKEEDWLFKKQPIKYSFHPNLKPIEFKNKLNQHDGIVADILLLIKQKSAIILEDKPYKTFKEAIDAIKAGKIDMLSAVIETEENKKYLNFTKHTLLSYYLVFIASNNDKKIYKSIDEFNNKTIGILTDEEKIVKKYPNLNYVKINSIKEGFEKLKNKKIDLFVLDNIRAAYQINNNYLDFHIAYKTDIVYNLKIAFRKDMPIEPLKIIDKALELIPPGKREEIIKKWTKKATTNYINWSLVGKIIGGFIVILLLVMWYNKTLKDKVREKTKELRDLADSLEEKVEERTKELKNAKEKIEEIHQHTQDSIEYASLIQNAILPKEELFKKAFKDYFIIWQPKDIVGGDIYLKR